VMETEHVDVVVIKGGVDDPEIPELQKKFISFVLESGATAADVIWERVNCSSIQRHFNDIEKLSTHARPFRYLVLSFRYGRRFEGSERRR
jgi:hypothetical protein